MAQEAYIINNKAMFQAAFTTVILLLVCESIHGGKRCGIDQFLNKKGKCRYCKFCPPGQGMDFTAQVETNEDGVPVACHPCRKCDDGYYNDPDLEQYACIKCRLNCTAMNRKEYEPCGGTKPGRCDGCINSLYEDRENNLDSPCYKKLDMMEKLELKREYLPETNNKVVSKSEDIPLDNQRNKQAVEATISPVVMVVALSLLSVFAISIVGLVIMVRRRTKTQPNCSRLKKVPSGNSLMGSSISDGVDNHGIRHQYTKVNPEDTDVETDGPLDEREPYGELQHYTSAGPAALRMAPEGNSHQPVSLSSRTYPRIVVLERDIYFKHLTKHLYGKHVPDVFRALEVRDQLIYSDLELYKLDRIKYEEAIHRLLLHWVRLKTVDATLDLLCPILEANGLKDLSTQLLKLAGTPEQEKRSPGHAARSPEQVTRSPEQVTEIPEQFTGTQEQISGISNQCACPKTTINTVALVHNNSHRHESGQSGKYTGVLQNKQIICNSQMDLSKPFVEAPNGESMHSLLSSSSLSITNFDQENEVVERETCL